MKHLPYRLRVQLYEAEKGQLRKRALSPKEYEDAIKQLARRLRL